MNNYCKTCCHDDGDIGFCDKCYYSHILAEKGILPTEYEAKPKPMTNADRIRVMTDDEMARLFYDMGKHKYDYPQSIDVWMEWLEQEIDDEHTD